MTGARGIAMVLFLGLACAYFALTPFAVAGMGYTMEEMQAGNQIVAHALDKIRGRPASGPIAWSRNGVVPVLYDIPFLLLGSLHADPGAWQDHYLALGPVLATAALLAILFVWLNRLTASPGWSLALTFIAAWCTLLWPYAYIGLETKQSLALFAAAYLALAPGRRSLWPALRTAAFAVACATAVCVKSTGLFLVPAVAFLVAEYFSPGDYRRPLHSRALALRVLATAAFIAAVFLLNGYFRSLYWAKLGGARGFLEYWMIRDPMSLAANMLAFFFSANKGLFVFAPVTAVALFALPRLVREWSPPAIFCLLALGGLVCGFSLLTDWSDETWGPRYLHSAVAPLLVCIGARERLFRLRARMAVYALAACGFAVASLGSLFTYGSLQNAATQAGQDTLEAYQGDIVWNHVRFNGRLLGIWMRHGNGPPQTVLWTPAHHWFYAVPPGAAEWKAADLGPLAYPQSILLRGFGVPRPAWYAPLWNCCVLAGIAGIALLAYAAYLTRAAGRGRGRLARSAC